MQIDAICNFKLRLWHLYAFITNREEYTICIFRTWSSAFQTRRPIISDENFSSQELHEFRNVAKISKMSEYKCTAQNLCSLSVDTVETFRNAARSERASDHLLNSAKSFASSSPSAMTSKTRSVFVKRGSLQSPIYFWHSVFSYTDQNCLKH